MSSRADQPPSGRRVPRATTRTSCSRPTARTWTTLASPSPFRRAGARSSSARTLPRPARGPPMSFSRPQRRLRRSRRAGRGPARRRRLRLLLAAFPRPLRRRSPHQRRLRRRRLRRRQRRTLSQPRRAGQPRLARRRHSPCLRASQQAHLRQSQARSRARPPRLGLLARGRACRSRPAPR